MSNFPKINKETLRELSLEKKTEILQQYIYQDVTMSLRYYKAEEGLDQITGEYTPGLAGMMVLERGLDAIKKLSLNEKGIDFMLLQIIEMAELYERMLEENRPGPDDEAIPVTHLELNTAKILRESFRLLKKD